MTTFVFNVSTVSFERTYQTSSSVYQGQPPACSIKPDECKQLFSAYSSNNTASNQTNDSLGINRPGCNTLDYNTKTCSKLCNILMGTARVLYWPTAVTTVGSICNKTGASNGPDITQAAPQTIAFGGTTLTSPTVYISINTMYEQSRKCGPQLTNIIFPMNSTDVSTFAGTWVGRFFEPASQFNFADLNTLTLNNSMTLPLVPYGAYSRQSKCFGYGGPDRCPIIYNDYEPNILLPGSLRELHPEWVAATCTFMNNGVYDPPSALKTAALLVSTTAKGVNTPTGEVPRPGNSIGAPGPTPTPTLAQPQKETQGVIGARPTRTVVAGDGAGSGSGSGPGGSDPAKGDPADPANGSPVNGGRPGGNDAAKSDPADPAKGSPANGDPPANDDPKNGDPAHGDSNTGNHGNAGAIVNPGDPPSTTPIAIGIFHNHPIAPALTGGGIIVASQTLNHLTPTITVDNTILSLDPSGNILAGTKTIAAVKEIANALSTTAIVIGTFHNNLITPAPTGGGVIIASQTLNHLTPTITVDNTIISLDPSGNVLADTKTIARAEEIASAASQTTNHVQRGAVITLGGQVMTIADSGPGGKFVINGVTLVPGGSAVTISGSVISAAREGVIVGSSTVPFSTLESSNGEGTAGIGGYIFSGLGAAAADVKGEVTVTGSAPSSGQFTSAADVLRCCDLRRLLSMGFAAALVVVVGFI
ncbi:hypothetical protein EJ08DRAFT_693060 [Tothia fuscella]|uniref:Uncharacterized protein n=1 Tax=Tothia fuscella TaxID=1048955 RepID=A0A9P4U327_9PEZI|nr:hypothetical protein EJ08DRAFT_693060 [Tothia fuscella]